MKDLKEAIEVFIKERDWEQFHSPKNLAMALGVEVAEIVEHFQWLIVEQSRNLPPEKLAEIREEIGDVMIYLTELADKLGIELDPLWWTPESLEAKPSERESTCRRVPGPATQRNSRPRRFSWAAPLQSSQKEALCLSTVDYSPSSGDACQPSTTSSLVGR